MKMVWFTTLSILFLVFVTPALLGLTLKMIPADDQPGYNSALKLDIYEKRTITQKFTSQEKNLTAIGMSIKNPNLNNKKDILLNIYDMDGNLVRTGILNGRNVQDGDFIKFVFDPISDSLGKTYTFNLSSPEAGPEDLIEVFYMTTPTRSILEYSYGGKVLPGGIPIVTFHKPDSKFEVVSSIYSSWLSRLLHLDSQKI
jgi:hypothetical protein